MLKEAYNSLTLRVEHRSRKLFYAVMDFSLKIGIGQYLFLNPDEYLYNGISKWSHKFKEKYELLNTDKKIGIIKIGTANGQTSVIVGNPRSDTCELDYWIDKMGKIPKKYLKYEGRYTQESYKLIKESKKILENLEVDSETRRSYFEKYATPNGGLR